MEKEEKPKILIVDDKPENLVALERVLKNLDVIIVKAGGGNEALKETLNHHFALALLDIQMPGMDGYELAGILREDEKTEYLPFIFISAIYTDHVNIFKGYEKGAFSFITKPFQPEILINKVRFFVDKYRQEQALIQSREELEEKVQERTLALQRSNEELRQFAHIVSHDLKTPLRAISSLAEWISEDYAHVLDAPGQDQFRLLIDRTKRVHNLVDGILAYSRLGQVNPVKKEIDLAALLPEVIDSIAPPANIQVVLVNPLPVIHCDRTHFIQIFQNLIDNAIKFMDKENGIIGIRCEKQKDGWLFAVEDNGPGIEQKYFEKIFQIFQTLNSGQNKDSTGVGLSLVKKIVELYGGTISVESTPGKGTGFFFNIPEPDHYKR